MSLRLRMVLLTVALVTFVVVALSVLYLDNLARSLASEASERSDFAIQQINAYLTDYINQHLADYPPPKNAEGTKAIWNRIVSEDYAIAAVLEKMAAASGYIIEINVAGDNGDILASSNPL